MSFSTFKAALKLYSIYGSTFILIEIIMNTVFPLISAEPKSNAAPLGIHNEINASLLITATPLKRRLLE